MITSVWGLSNFVITKHNCDEKQVKETAERWLQFVNISGFAGDASLWVDALTPSRMMAAAA